VINLPDRPDAVRKFIEKLGNPSTLRVCYEAGPPGCALLYWQLTKMDVECEVVAPSLIPKKPGERIKTERRDAEKLAPSFSGGVGSAGRGKMADYGNRQQP
jgi:transposase